MLAVLTNQIADILHFNHDSKTKWTNNTNNNITIDVCGNENNGNINGNKKNDNNKM